MLSSPKSRSGSNRKSQVTNDVPVEVVLGTPRSSRVRCGDAHNMPPPKSPSAVLGDSSGGPARRAFRPATVGEVSGFHEIGKTSGS